MKLKSGLPSKKPKTASKPKSNLIDAGLRFLAVRPRSTAELRFYLSSKTKNQIEVTHSISYLLELGLLNDHKFASWLARGRLARGKGSFFIKKELHHRFSVDQGIIDQTIAQISTSDQVESAKKVLAKRAYNLEKLQPKLAVKKAHTWLRSRGFPGQISQIAIDEYLAKE